MKIILKHIYRTKLSNTNLQTFSIPDSSNTHLTTKPHSTLVTPIKTTTTTHTRDTPYQLLLINENKQYSTLSHLLTPGIPGGKYNTLIDLPTSLYLTFGSLL